MKKKKHVIHKSKMKTNLSREPSSFWHSLLSNLLWSLSFFTHLFGAQLSKLETELALIRFYNKKEQN